MADISHSQLLRTASHPASLAIIDLSWSRSECLLLGFLLIAIVSRFSTPYLCRGGMLGIVW
jgi:hypothetical protein